MVKGLPKFREHFREYEQEFVLIGALHAINGSALVVCNFAVRRTWTLSCLWKA